MNKEEIRVKAEKFFNSQRHNCSDVELSRGAVYYPVSFITEILETYKRECVIEELENQIKDLEYAKEITPCKTEALTYSGVALKLLSRISELKK